MRKQRSMRARKAWTPARKAGLDPVRPSGTGAVPGVATHYFTRYRDFENLLKGSALQRAGLPNGVSDQDPRQLQRFVSGPAPYEGTDMTDATNPVPSLFPP